MAESENKINLPNYDESDIQVLEGLEAVRKRPGMYIGSTDERGLHHLVTEIVDNSIDEAMAGYCNEILVTLLKDNGVSVIDNGRGIPTGIHKTEKISAVEVVLTKLHAGGKFGGKGYQISGGLHGVGLSVVNALSNTLIVEVFQNGKHYMQTYHKGAPAERLKVVNETKITGTKVTFYPDDTIFETCNFSYDTLKSRLREIAFLNKGLKILIRDEREEKVVENSFQFMGGIAEFVQDMTAQKGSVFAEPVYIDKKYNTKNAAGTDCLCEIEISFQYTDTYSENIHSYANNINTEEGGTHLDGFKQSVSKIINDYAVKNNLLKDGQKLSGEDTREGIVAIVSVKLQDPQFEGQTKTKLGNSEMRTIVSKAMTDNFAEYMEEHPKESRVLISKCILSQRAREAARNARDLTRRKSVLENTTLPGKLADCSEKDPKVCEIFLVEGDSAGGTAKQGRDRRFQAILPLRGKILNVEKTRLAKALENDEIKNMITAFGCGISNDCDPQKLRYDKIVCMTDADVDGSHIRTLLLTFFFRFMRPLIEQGHIYVSQPPLYKVTRGRDISYYYSDAELDAHLDTNGRKGISVQRYKGLGEMNAEELWETTMSPQHRILKQIRMEDGVSANETFDTLMGERPELRRKFIEEHASLVKNLDI